MDDLNRDLTGAVRRAVGMMQESQSSGLAVRTPPPADNSAAMLNLMFSAMMGVTGLILDSVSRGRAEQKRIFYLSIPARRAKREARELSPPAGKRGSTRAA